MCDRLPQMWPWVVGVVAVVGVLGSVRDAVAPGAWLPIDALPLASWGLGWVVPAIAAACIGALHAKVSARGACR